MFTMHLGDCVATMRAMPTASIDSIVTDPPYELGFMGKSWDASGIAYSVEMWAEALRVLKPGGHLLAFSGSRTYHRMVCAIEDAGFEIRDQIMWVYGSGFPKSLDVSKAIDKAAGAERQKSPTVAMRRKGEVGEISKNIRCATCGKARASGNPCVCPRLEDEPATDAARQWQGWGTALKPAHEPIVVARKPLIGTVAANVLQHGTGAINVDGCRVDSYDGASTARKPSMVQDTAAGFGKGIAMGGNGSDLGRWPANLIHDGSGEVLAAFPQDAARFYYAAKASKADRNEGLDGFTARAEPAHRRSNIEETGDNPYLRGVTERLNTHPTVKPTDLMRYLCRLVTPPGGTVLDPFTGSGSTGKAAVLEGFRFVGCELSPEYVAIAEARITAAGCGGFA